MGLGKTHLKRERINMSRNITRHAGIRVYKPRPTDISIRFINSMVDPHILSLQPALLILFHHTLLPTHPTPPRKPVPGQPPREPQPTHRGPNRHDPQRPPRRAHGFLIQGHPRRWQRLAVADSRAWRRAFDFGTGGGCVGVVGRVGRGVQDRGWGGCEHTCHAGW